jgi:hypothetical protein
LHVCYLHTNRKCPSFRFKKKYRIIQLRIFRYHEFRPSKLKCKIFNIGEPNKFYLPLSLYGGVSNNPVQSGTNPTIKTNEHLVTGFINPLSGLLNVSFEDIIFRKRDSIINTKFGISYQIGERVMYGVRQDSINKIPVFATVNFVNSYFSGGLFFQTQAWEKNKADNIGVFWISLRVHATRTGIKQLRNFLPKLESNGIYTGYSAGFGVSITNSVDIKAIYYNYIKRPEIDYFNSIYQFSLNYTLNK